MPQFATLETSFYQELRHYNDLKDVLHSIYERKAAMSRAHYLAMYRSKGRWIESGEKPTKCFFNLKKETIPRR